MTVRTIDDVFRDFEIDGVPSSGIHHPYKPDIRDTLKALTEGGDNFPDDRIIRLNNANAGTANNIVVTSSVPIPSAAFQVLYILNVTQENTGPVTVSGAISRNVVTNQNEPLGAGYIKPGMAILAVDTGTSLRLLNIGDVDAEIIDLVNHAIAAKDAAELARDEAQDAARDAVSQGNVPIYSTRNSVETLEIPSGITAIRTNGYSTVGDGGGAMYRRVSSEPSHAGKVQSSDGAWWELSENKVCPEMFGANADGINDDADAIQDAVDYMFEMPVGGEFNLSPGKDYAIGKTIPLIKRPIKQITINGNGARLVALSGFVGYNGVKDIIYAGASTEDVSGYPCIIKGVRFSSYEPLVNAVRLNWSGWSQVFQCAFDDVYNGVMLDNGFAVTISQNYFYNLSNNGIRAVNLSMSVVIDKNRFAAIANGDVAFMEAARNISIRDNSMEGGPSAISLVGVSSSILIEGNYIEGKTGNPVFIGADTHGFAFNNNWLGYNAGTQEWVNIVSGEMKGNSFPSQMQYMSASVRNIDISHNAFWEGSNVIYSPFENAALINGYYNASGYGEAGYRQTSSGEVLLKGVLVGPSNTAAFTLPIGMRPSVTKAFISRGIDGTQAGITVNPSGNIAIFRGSDNSVILDCVSFTPGS